MLRIVLSSVLLLGAAGAHAAGSLDARFSGDGIAVHDSGGGEEDGLDAGLIDAQGRLVGAGYQVAGGQRRAVLMRWLPNGALDPAFGSGGVAVVAAEASFLNHWYDLVELPDGRLVASGLTQGPEGNQSQLCRFLDDGSLDEDFGKEGCLRPALEADTQSDSARALALQPDGRVVFAGNVVRANDSFEWYVARLLDDGSFDPCFGDLACAGGGVVIAPGPIDHLEVKGADIGPDGRIVVVGDATDEPPQVDMAAVRLLPTGGIDNSFGGTGAVRVDLDDVYDDRSRDVEVLSDNAVLIVGSTENATGLLPMVVGLTPFGTLDAGYGTGLGRTVLPFDDVSQFQVAAHADLQADGSLVIAGYAQGDGANCAVARLDPAGEPDTRFGIDGITIVDSTFGQPPLLVDVCLGVDVRGDAIAAFGYNGTTLPSRNSMAVKLEASGIFRNGFED